MNDRRNRGISGASVLIFILVLFGALWFTNQMDQKENELNWNQFEKLIATLTLSRTRMFLPGGLRLELRMK